MATKVLSFKEQFTQEIAPALKKELKLKNVNAVPKVSKVVVNVGMGKLLAGSKDYAFIADNIAAITGQKAVVALSRKSISNFKLREKMPIGLFVTLRGKNMYNFLSKLVNISLPRVRDFRGISPRSFDGQGNYTLGLKEHIMFPEINADDMNKIHGIEITVVTTAKNNADGLALLTALGFPFQVKKAKETTPTK